MAIDEMLDLLPSKKSLPLIIHVADGEDKGIADCGEKYFFVIPIYKILTREREMLTYIRLKDTLYLMFAAKLHY